MKAIDLFAGPGGLALGLQSAGFQVVAAIESDDLAVKRYRANHPDVLVRHADIRSVDPTELLAELEEDVPFVVELRDGGPGVLVRR